jgi:protein-S-isoprenylcysteine O-methyltransferase Ste14
MPRVVAPILKTVVFTIVVPGFVAVWVPHQLARPISKPPLDAITIIACLLTTLGAAAYLTTAWTFAYHGLGTPAIVDPPKTLIARGLHRYVRNPMYISVLLVVLGQAALFRSWPLLIYAACLWLFFHLFVLFYEEPVLQKKFGASYEQYRHSVPRWIPHL